MTRLLTLSLFVGLLSFNISCAGKKKAGEGAGVGDVSADSSIGTKDMAFDPMGSDSGNINGLQTINFDYDSSNLNTEARKILAANADWIKAHTEATIQVEGHCDSRGSVEYNLALGERRAKSVKNYLTSLGIDGKRLTVISYGKEKPIASGDNEEAFSKNRRANFVPLPN